MDLAETNTIGSTVHLTKGIGILIYTPSSIIPIKRQCISLYKVKWNKVKVTQSCLTLCDPMDYTVHGILQIRILEWVAFPFSRGPSQPRNLTRVSWIADGFFTNWAIREVLLRWYIFNRKLQQCNSERNVVPMKRGNTRVRNCLIMDSIWASQVALLVKNLYANAGDIRDMC